MLDYETPEYSATPAQMAEFKRLASTEVIVAAIVAAIIAKEGK